MDSFQPIRSIPHLVPSPFSVRLQRDSPIHSLPISRSYPIQPGPSPIVPHCRPFPTVKTLSTKDMVLFNPLRAWAILSSLSDSEQAFNRRNPYLIRTPFRYPLCHPCEKYMAVKHFLGYRKDLPSPRSPPSLLLLMPSLLVTQCYSRNATTMANIPEVRQSTANFYGTTGVIIPDPFAPYPTITISRYCEGASIPSDDDTLSSYFISM